MTKKTKETLDLAAVGAAAIENTTPGAGTKPARYDPALLGVPVPLNLTLSATKQVADAWRECLIALAGAIKARRAAKAPVAATTDPGAPGVVA